MRPAYINAVHSENRDAPIRFDHDAGQPHIGQSGVAGIVRGRGFRRALRRAQQRFGDLPSLRSGFNFRRRRAPLK
jgi:hypothetical protein